MSHSKRNTSRPVFTSHERALAKSHWGTSSARLNRDSFLPFGSCCLCLEIARDPVACQRGDIFCRECALANLVAQKKELKRAEKLRQDAEKEIARIKALEDEEERERAVRDFETTQAGLALAARRRPLEASTKPGESETAAGTKRKFTLDDDELERIAREDKVKARKAIDDDKAAKPSLPSFWTPSLTPDAHDIMLSAAAKKGKTTATCPASAETNPHALSMHKLVSIKFEEDIDSSSTDKRRICPSCRKAFSNSSGPIMAKQCGHVFCRSCVNKILVPSTRQSKSNSDSEIPLTCYVCDVPLDPKGHGADSSKGALHPGLVALRSEGTGFSARGTSTVEKSDVAFQC